MNNERPLIVPAINSSGHFSHTLNILFDLRKAQNTMNFFLEEVNNLSMNISQDSPVKINLLIPSLYEELEFENIESLPFNDSLSYEKNVQNYSDKIDLLVTEDKTLVETFKKASFEVKNIKDAMEFIEIFLKGNDYPWSFAHKVYNHPWTTFYLTSDETGKEGYKKYEEATKVNVDKDSLNILRYLLLNRLGNLLFTRDRLLFYVQEKRRAKIRGWKRQDYNFELSYYLGYYYLLISGGLDQLAMVVKEILALDISAEEKIDIRLFDEKFLAKVNTKSLTIRRIFDEEFQEWYKGLRLRRNFIAHEGSLTLTELVEEPDEGFDDKKIEKEVERQMDWTFLSQVAAPNELKEYKEWVRGLVKLQQYRVVAEDIFVVSSKATKKNKRKTFIFKPLLLITSDHDRFKRIMFEAVKELFVYRIKMTTAKQ